MVAKEIKRAKPLEMQLGGADTFSATPPIEAVCSLLSMFMSKDPDKGELKLANWDISHAHFMGKASRDLFMELPEEDKIQDSDVEPMVAKLMRSMYGTQDASRIFQEDYQQWLQKGDKKSMTFLNRLIKYVPDGADHEGRRLEIEADARHTEILLREFGFNKSRGVRCQRTR